MRTSANAPAQEALLNNITAALSLSIWILDSDGRFVEQVGKSNAEVDPFTRSPQGQRLDQLLPRETVAEGSAALRAALIDGATQTLSYRRPADDTKPERWFELQLTPLPPTTDTRAPRLSCLIRDVSGYKSLQNDLEAARVLDPLTGVHNQRHFMSVLDAEIKRQERYKEPVSLLLLEVEHFEAFREAYGEETVNSCLQEVARLIRQQLRHSDILARLEEAEFGILLINTPLGLAKEVAERVRRRIARTPVTLRNKTLRLTVTGGVTAHREGDSASSLLWRTEEALFHSETEGRSGIRVT
ncbi:hypothetical protein CAI21_02895 [Alkalilimnicola ehrlichii]|uniref:diguanylate cyclase n=1 Tax=Alkalilimnicola ehrlichii TaxID=351052 RepID=A0A3E0X2M2_9GAMM|nr:sensor domain-containing diguanylate cyclase [Alkalilimnicola ehrlichii]RFA30941.1 hypothetical protein CAI21_02895 [Alkalilimnicola ehrlichii]RFA38891.1 hypothetical protein CAL65_03030 [Alkalilimnicola ehrlichii]